MPPQGKTNASQAQPAKVLRTLSPQEAFAPLNELEKQAKLLISPFPGESFHYYGLRPDNCFGLLLSNGKRLVGQSDGKVGMDGTVEKIKVVSIGFLWTEGPIFIGGEELASGSYVLFAGESTLRISDKPMPFGLEVPLVSKIDLALLNAGSKEPFFTLTEEKNGVNLRIGANNLPITLK